MAFSVCSIVCLLSTSYGSLLNFSPLLRSIFDSSLFQNSFFAAIVWYCVAIYLVNHQNLFPRFARPYVILGVVVLWGAEFILVKVFNLSIATDFFVFLVPVAISVFSWSSTHSVILKKSTIDFLTQFSLYLYVLQTLAADIVRFLLHQPQDSIDGLLLYFLVVIVDSIISCTVLFVS